MEHRKEIIEKCFLLNDNHLHSSGLDLSRIVVTQGHGWKGDKEQFLGDPGCKEVQKLSLTIIFSQLSSGFPPRWQDLLCAERTSPHADWIQGTEVIILSDIHTEAKYSSQCHKLPFLTLKHSHKAWDGEHESDIFYVSVQTFALSLLVVNNTGKDDLHTFWWLLVEISVHQYID